MHYIAHLWCRRYRLQHPLEVRKGLFGNLPVRIYPGLRIRSIHPTATMHTQSRSFGFAFVFHIEGNLLFPRSGYQDYILPLLHNSQ